MSQVSEPSEQSQQSQTVSPVSGGGVILKPPSFRSRTWCFTINNYSKTDIDSVVSIVSASHVSDWIYGFEEGTEGTKHIQGYFRSKNQIRFGTLKKKLPRAHLTFGS